MRLAFPRRVMRIAPRRSSIDLNFGTPNQMQMWPFGRSRTVDVVAVERQEPRLLNASPENPSTNLADPASWLTDWASGGAPGVFGPHVSERTSMCSSAVYRCVALKSGAVAGLPLKIYERTADGRKEAFNHRLQPMFQMAP